MSGKSISLSIEEKRQAVYTSYYRYAPEAIHLRQRAIQRVVLGALLGSTQKDPYRISRIRKNLSFDSLNFGIRTERIQEALSQLIIDGKVEQNIVKGRDYYFLTQQGEAEVTAYAVSSENLFSEVASRLFRDTYDYLPNDLAYQIFRKFAFECLGRYGLQIAQYLIGHASRENSAERIDARSAFESAINGFALSEQQREALEVRCDHFIKASDPIFDKLKFFLTQGYFFALLLGVEQKQFDPLAEQAFNGSVFYLDTNVLLVGLVEFHEAGDDFVEMIRLAKKLGIELRVTEATLLEAERVLFDRIPKIQKIKEVLPDELSDKTNDQILLAYKNAEKKVPGLSIKDFFEPVTNLRNELLYKWEIMIDNRKSEDIINSRNISELSAIVNEEAENSRGWGKSNPVIQHDAAHFLLVFDERENNPKTWFLTRDRSLEAVSNRLKPDSPPFSFSHVGFLHSISPFVTSPKEEYSLAEIMSGFICEQIRPMDTLFDVSELAIMADYHEDVMATPPDQLLMAFDYVKSQTLKGKPYREGDIPKVSLELRKFLSARRDQQLQAFQDERNRLIKEASEERERRATAEEERQREIERRIELEEEVSGLSNIIDATQVENINISDRLAAERQKTRIIIAVIGVIVGYLSLQYGPNIAGYIIAQIPQLYMVYNWILVVLRIVATLLVTIPLLFVIKHTKLKKEIKTLMITVLAIFGFAIARIVTKEELSVLSDLVGLGASVGAYIGSFFVREKE